MAQISNDLLEAYKGYYENREDEMFPAKTSEEHILTHSPKERLEVYLEWNGIIGYATRAFEIATGEL